MATNAARSAKRAGIIIAAIVACGLLANFVFNRITSEETTMFTCTACLKSDPARCATYTDDQGMVSATEAEAREHAVTQFCIRVWESGGEPNCGKWTAEQFTFRCSRFTGRASRALLPAH